MKIYGRKSFANIYVVCVTVKCRLALEMFRRKLLSSITLEAITDLCAYDINNCEDKWKSI